MFLLAKMLLPCLREYPLIASAQAKVHDGEYTYVAWVGDRQFTGSFSLFKDQDMVLNIFKDRIGIIWKLLEL